MAHTTWKVAVNYAAKGKAMMENRQLEMDLREALARQEFRLYYQPKIDLTTGKITGTEALIRWQHPQKGMIPPMEFIPLMEETDLITSIGEWVLRTACTQHKAWQEIGIAPGIMAVNLSARQFYQSDFAERIRRILEETKLAPENLEVEITEHMIMDIDYVLPILSELKRMGVRVSLDDFGTGYSSLYYLNRLPIDVIKIDQSFVQNCTVDTKDGTIIKTIIAMAHQLKMDVIAEGIESRDHLIFLQQHLCNQGQGYFFSRPLPPDEIQGGWEHICGVIKREGIPHELSREKWLEEELETARQELRDTVRWQQGSIFKFINRQGRFIYTLCDGELVYRLGLSPELLIGRELTDFRAWPDAERILSHYRRAWSGEDYVTYEEELNGVWYLTSLRPIRKGGQVVEVIASSVDITKRVKREQEVALLAERLAEREAQYRLIADHTNDFVVLLDARGIVRYASPSYERILGHSMAGREGHAGFRTIHPDDLSLVKQAFNAVVMNRSSVTIELRIATSFGTFIWAESIMSPIQGTDGEVQNVLVVSRDITERKRQEERLRESEERYRRIAKRLAEQEAKYRLIAENSHDLIKIVDRNGVLQYASPSHERIFGKGWSPLEGPPAFSMVHPDDLQHVRQRWNEMLSTKTSVRIEWRVRKTDGGWVWIECIGTPILASDGQIDNILITGREITKRKEQEEKARQGGEHYRLIAENTQDLIVILDRNGVVTYASPSHATVLGFPTNRVVGHSAFDLIHADDQADVARQFADLVLSKAAQYVEFRCRHALGHWVYVEANGAYVCNDEGEVEQYVVVARQIAGRKRTEDMVRKLSKCFRTGKVSFGRGSGFTTRSEPSDSDLATVKST